MLDIEMTAGQMVMCQFQVGRCGFIDIADGVRGFELYKKLGFSAEERELIGFSKPLDGPADMQFPNTVLKRRVTAWEMERLRFVVKHPPVPWLTEAMPLIAELQEVLGISGEEEAEE